MYKLFCKKITVTENIKLLHRLSKLVQPFWRVLLLGVCANIIYTLIDTGLTYMTRSFLEKGFIQVDLNFVKTIPLILLVVITGRGIVSSVAGYCMTYVARSVVKVLRQTVFSHVIKLPSSYYDNAPSGQLLSKILYDVEQVAQVSADALTDFVQNFFLVIGLLTVMLVLCWQLSLLFLITIPFVGFIVNSTNKRMRRLSHNVQQTMGKVTEVASEAIDGYRVIRVFGGEFYETNKFNKTTELACIQDMKVAASKALNVAGVQIVVAIGIALIIFVAVKLATFIIISAGSFVAIIAAMLQLIKPLKILTTLNSTFQRGLAGAESIFNLIDQPLENSAGIVLQHPLNGNINFDRINFYYNQSSHVLREVSLTIKSGQKVALVGSSGSGKTTISSLLLRFYQANNGTITIDNMDINSLSLTSLRSQIALVSQQTTLFNDTIANNIAYGNAEYVMDKIIHAAKLSYAHEFISLLPDGYESRIGENGVLLSGGQRQRLAIARAIFKNAPILILDEATSALDSTSEHIIQKALEHVMHGKTTLIIAHRLSTIQTADKIVVLDRGRIVEEGTHASLLAINGYYSGLFYSQIKRLSKKNVDCKIS
ncbi:MAG: lipid A export permease/ATP-binding protein MsbA [Legionellales bacterium RIFCSPHIGHO2_12_FULL_35_11]|nr:MAG: lipid A export permease/ATP-binding protein MsbA [Legionellales bacterium RIFCSPHIGHO2_12_FULL_35_11]